MKTFKKKTIILDYSDEYDSIHEVHKDHQGDYEWSFDNRIWYSGMFRWEEKNRLEKMFYKILSAKLIDDLLIQIKVLEELQDD